MPVIYANETTNIVLTAGDVLTITPDSGAAALIYSNGEYGTPFASIGSTVVTIGPFIDDAIFRLEGNKGKVSYAISDNTNKNQSLLGSLTLPSQNFVALGTKTDSAGTPDGVLYDVAGNGLKTLLGIIDVMSPAFGAKGDWNGTTGTDDTAAIQAAITYALANKIRTIKLGYAHKITDLNLTNAYYSGLIFEGVSTQNDTANKSTIVVSGAASQGVDISGSSGIEFKNLNITGDTNAPPVCCVYASRTTLSNESYGHIFNNVGFFGKFSVAAIYNYAGEGWSFTNCRQNTTAGMLGYFTAKNSLAKASKFSTHTASGINFLTFTEFDNFDFRSQASLGESSVWFEGNYTAGAIDVHSVIENIDFRHCYFASMGATGQSGACIKLTDVSGAVCVEGCRDESYSTTNANAPDAFMQIDSSGANSILIGLAFRGGAFMAQRWAVKGGNVQDFAKDGVKCYTNSSAAGAIAGWPYTGLTKLTTWQFAYLDGCSGRLSPNENFVVTTNAYLVSVRPGSRTTTAQISLPAGTINHAYDRQYHGTPYSFLNSEVRGELCFDDYYRRMYMAVGITAGADNYAWQDVGYKEYANANANPATDAVKLGNTYSLNQIVWNDAPAPSGYIGWVCTTTGTAGTLAGVSFTSTVGSPVIVITTGNALSKLAIGQWCSFAGWFNGQILSVDNNNQITIASNASNSLVNNALAFVAPVFKNFGVLTA